MFAMHTNAQDASTTDHVIVACEALGERQSSLRCFVQISVDMRRSMPDRYLVNVAPAQV
jgi:hypothetical protein